MVISAQIVNSYAASVMSGRPRRTAWDFEEESPLRDARGFDLAAVVAPEFVEAEEDAGMANVILTNGARLYVDHAHPEFSTPEVTTPLIWSRGTRPASSSCRSGAPGCGPAQCDADQPLQEQHRQQGRLTARTRTT
jgi:hypothetical protein